MVCISWFIWEKKGSYNIHHSS